jgi:hypothetical protein
MATFVFGPGLVSAESLLPIVGVFLVLALAHICQLRRLEASATNWRRFSSWFPVAAERYDERLKGYNPALAAMVIMQRAQRAEAELRAYRQQNAPDPHRRRRLIQCKNCGTFVTRQNDVWVHVDSTEARCGIGSKVAVPEVRQ